jgi:hypothetical protein
MQPELPSTPVSIGELLDSAIRLYRSTFSRCWTLALASSLCNAALGVMLAWSVPQQDVGRSGNAVAALQQALNAMAQAFFSPPVIGGWLLVIFLSSVLFGAIMATESTLARGNSAFSAWSAIGVGLRRFPTAFVASLLWGIIIAVGWVLLIIPGIYFIGKLQLWMAAVFVDGAGPVQALRTSWRLTRRRWWRGVIILSVIVIIVYVFTIAFNLLGSAAVRFVSLSVTQRMIVVEAFAVISNVLLLPLTAAIAIAMYHDFKLRAEGGDLAARMTALGKS